MKLLIAYSIIIKQIMIQGSKNTALVDFQPLDKIGEGSFSWVYKVRRVIDDKIYALKKVKLSHLAPKDINNSLNEARILASIESPFIVQYREAFYDENAHALCIVMEWADGGDLQKIINNQLQQKTFLSQEEIWKAAAQILSGLQLLHSKGILHRDLKTANIFSSAGIYKIGDMNVSKVQCQQKQMAYTQTGTPYYASPEVWKDEPYDAKSDIWSFGCIIYEMCALHPPFEGKNIEVLYKKIKKGKYDKIPDIYSTQLTDFIGHCLHQNPKQRPTAKQLLQNKHSIIDKKCKEYGIKLIKDSSFKLLKTIQYKSSEYLKFDLPYPRYDRTLKNTTEDTFEKSRSDHLSPLGQLQTAEKSARPLKKESKAGRLKKCHERIIKITKMLRQSQQKNSSSSSSRCQNQFISLKNIQKKHELPHIVQRNFSERQIGALIDFPKRYPKYSRARNLTTERKQSTEAQSDYKQLDVIKEIRKRLDHQKNKVKKTSTTAQISSSKIISAHKKNSFVAQIREDQESKLLGQRSSKQIDSDGIVKSNKKLKKPTSIPYLRGALARAESAANQDNKVENSKRINYLKKKPKKLLKA